MLEGLQIVDNHLLSLTHGTKPSVLSDIGVGLLNGDGGGEDGLIYGRKMCAIFVFNRLNPS